MKSNITKMITLCLCMVVVGFAAQKGQEPIKIEPNTVIQGNSYYDNLLNQMTNHNADEPKVVAEKQNPDQEKIDYYNNLKLNPPHQDPYDGSRDCGDTDAGATDSYGDGCAGYTMFPSWCGGYDDVDFDSMAMCCACGGGADDGLGDLYCPDGDGSAYSWAYTGAYSSEVTWDLVAADGTVSAAGNGGSGSFCLADGDYTANMHDSYGDGWNGSVSFYDANGDLAVTIAFAACNSWEGCTEGNEATADVTFGGAPPVPGCTDASAENYDAGADLDDGSCTWNGGCSSSSYTMCDDASGWSGGCVPTSYFCDGWVGNGSGTYTNPDCADGSDEDADCCGIGDNNYTEEVCAEDCNGDIFGSSEEDCAGACGGSATIDDCGVCDGDGSSCACDDLTVCMTDSYGDSWNGNVLTIGIWSGANDGSTGSDPQCESACIDLSVANDVTCGGGSWPGEVSWSIADAGGNELLAGGAPYAGCLGTGCAVYGCTDSNSDNYNADATVDDGSCSAYIGMDCAYFGYPDQSVDCNLIYCVPNSWLGDGGCDSAYFACAEFGCDGGDCDKDCAGDCLGSAAVDDCGICDGGNASNDCNDDCSGSFSAGWWINENPGGMDPDAPTLVYGEADDGSWYLDDCIWLESPSEVYNEDGTQVTITSVYGSDDVFSCELSSDVFNGAVTTTNISTHSTADFSVIGDISFTMSNGTNLNFTSTGTFDGINEYGELEGSLAGGSTGGAVLSGCDNTCGSTLENDECGVCGGGGIADGDCDCDGNVTDCAGTCGGDAAADNCGTCDSDPSNDCAYDCEGVAGGDAFLDCNGDCADGYYASWVGDNYCDNGGFGPDLACAEFGCDGGDCDGACGCNDDTSCADECGVPNGDGSSCADCAGEPNGDAEPDYCGLCEGGNAANECCDDSDGCLFVSLVDSYGDGWNGAVLTIGDQSYTIDGGASAEYSYCGGSDVAVTCSNGSWPGEVSWSISNCEGDLLAGGAPFDGCLGTCPEPEGCSDSECTLTMNDSYGDGWNDGLWTSGDQSAGLPYGTSTGTADFCFDTSVANSYSCGGSSYNSEISWTLSCDDGTTASGGAPEDGCFGNCGGRDADTAEQEFHAYSQRMVEAKAFAIERQFRLDNPIATPDASRDDCGGTGPDVGCDGVCFSGLEDVGCGCGDPLNDDGCCGDDSADCNGACGGTAVDDCADDDCWGSNWVGDGFCDGSAQQYGADLLCYECDGGDCIDECGICDGDSSSCADCCGLPNGDNSSCGGTGDVNGGGVDVTDIIIIVDAILETSSLDECQANEADITGDGNVNVLDVIGIVDIILSGIVSGCTDANAPEYNADATADDGSCWASCAGNTSWLGDGWCDGSNNNAECAWDAGDCCPGDCVSTTYDCAVYGGDCATCADPNSADLAEGGACDEYEVWTDAECAASVVITGGEGCYIPDNAYGVPSAYFSFAWDGGCTATAILYSGGEMDLSAYGFTGGFTFFGFALGAVDDFILWFGDAIASAEGVAADCIECGEDYWDCGDGYCIQPSWVCDGSSEFCNATWGPDCANGADEGLELCDYTDDCTGEPPTCAETGCGYYLNYGYTCDQLSTTYGYDCSACETEGACGGDDCVDTDDQSDGDSWGDTCASWYDTHTDDCCSGSDCAYNDDDFDSAAMCCACGGGSTGGGRDADFKALSHNNQNSDPQIEGSPNHIKKIAKKSKGNHSLGRATKAIQFESKLQRAGSVKLIQTAEGLKYEADGFVGFEITLSHGADFEINVTESAFIAEYKTTGNTTKVIVVGPETENLFSSTGDYEIVDVIAGTTGGTALAADIVSIPTVFGLKDAYPNPFNPTTSVELAMPQDGFVSVKIYNLMGQVVATLHEGNLTANSYSFTWDAANVASGMYFLKAETAGNMDIQKIMLMK